VRSDLAALRGKGGVRVLTRRRFLKLGLGAVAVGSVGVALGIAAFDRKPDYASGFHPFVSREARDRYLARYDEAAKAWPVPSETRMVKTYHGETFVRVGGPRDAPPLVLLPGNSLHSLEWIGVIETLSERYRTYAVDNIADVGRSISTRPVKSTGDYMAWLDGLFDALDLAEGVNLMCTTRGASLAAEYVLHAPQRLRKVVWLSPTGIVRIDYVRNIRGMAYFVGVSVAPSKTTYRALMRWLMPDMADANERELNEFADDSALASECYDPSAIQAVYMPRVFDDEELAGIEVPVLYMAGEDEVMDNPANVVERLNAVAPEIETEVFPNAGHALLNLQPVAVTRRILEFLDAR
jgi:pimeloyl-ACP methyl ester carboxylesterase